MTGQRRLMGSTRWELDPAERSIFIDFLCLAGADDGFIRANPETPSRRPYGLFRDLLYENGKVPRPRASVVGRIAAARARISAGQLRRHARERAEEEP